MIPWNVRQAARHEAAHATAAERLGGGWRDLWVDSKGNGRCWARGGSHALQGKERAAFLLAGLWVDHTDGEPYTDSEEWVQVYLSHLEDRLTGHGVCTEDTLNALEALGLPPPPAEWESHPEPWTLPRWNPPDALLDAARLCHQVMVDQEAQARVDALTAALLSRSLDGFGFYLHGEAPPSLDEASGGAE